MSTTITEAKSAPYQAPNKAVLRLVAAAPILQTIIVYKAVGTFVKPAFKRPVKACLQAVKSRKRRQEIEAKEDMAKTKVERVDIEWTW